MSLVGPRPERPEFLPGLEEKLLHTRERLSVRPGITGLAQVQLPADTDIESVRRKLAQDLLYIQTLSFWLDVPIMISTVLHVLGLKFVVGRFLLTPPALADMHPAQRKDGRRSSCIAIVAGRLSHNRRPRHAGAIGIAVLE